MGKGGKSKGKTLLGIIGFGLGFANPGWFGLTAKQTFLAGLYGASLGSTIWSVMHPPKMDSFNTNNYSRFDQLMNQVDSNSVIPIIYGERKWAGNQLWHNTSSDNMNLTKDVLIGEGEIEGIYDVRANDLFLTGNAISVLNTKYPDSTIQFSSKTLYYTYLDKDGNSVTKESGSQKILYLKSNNTTIEILVYEDKKEALRRSNVSETWFFNSIQELVNKIESYDGWKVSYYNNSASIQKLNYLTITNCYNNSVNIIASGISNCSYAFYNGAKNQSPPSNYKVVGGYKNCAWLRANLTVSNELQGGNPTITYIAKGIKVKVYENGKWIRKWSNNPAYCLLDYLTNRRYGLGRYFPWESIDLDSFIEEANYCSQSISYKMPDGTIKTEPRYSLNIIMDQQQDAINHIADILAVFGGFLVFSNGKVSLRVEKPTPISYSFTEKNIIEKSMSFSQTPLSETPNQYHIKYFDPAQNWTSVPAIVEDVVDQQFRDKINKKEVTLAGCTSQSQALRLGRLYKDLNKLCSILINFSTSSQGIHLEPGDIVTVTHKTGNTIIFENMPFRILEIEETGQNIISIKARQYNESIYNDKLDREIIVKNYVKIPNPTKPPSDVKNIQLEEDGYTNKDGVHISNIYVNFEPSIDQFAKSYDIYYKYNDEEWVFHTSLPSTLTNCVINNVFTGKYISVKIVTSNSFQVKSAGIISDSILISGKDSPPSNIEDFIVAQSKDMIILSGKNPKDIDFNRIEIRVNGTGWDNAKFIAYINSFPAQIRNTDILDGTHIFRAKVIDNAGNKSQTDATFILDLQGTNLSKNIILERDDVELQSGTLNNLVRLPNNKLITPHGIVYGDYSLYGDLPITNYPSENTHAEILSDIIDTFKVGMTGINYIFDYNIYDQFPLYGSYSTRKYGDYIYDTYGNITANNIQKIEVRFSNDNLEWSDWQPYLAANYNFRYIQYKLSLDFESITARVEIKSLKQYYDVPDLVFSTTLSIPVEGMDILFSDYNCDFYNPPTEINATVINGLGNIFPDITNLTVDGLHIDCYNRNGIKVSGQINLTCKGW